MNQSTRFTLLFAGRMRDGFTYEEVRRRFKSQLNLTDTVIAKLMSGAEVIVRRDVDRDTALRFQKQFHEAGAMLSVRVVKNNQANLAPAPRSNLPKKPQASPVVDVAMARVSMHKTQFGVPVIDAVVDSSIHSTETMGMSRVTMHAPKSLLNATTNKPSGADNKRQINREMNSQTNPERNPEETNPPVANRAENTAPNMSSALNETVNETIQPAASSERGLNASLPNPSMSAHYSAVLWLSSAIALVAPLFYFSTLLGAAALTIWGMSQFSEWLQNANSLLIIAYSLVFIIVPFCATLFLLKPLFVKVSLLEPRSLDRLRYRPFFELVESLCDSLGVEYPAEIHVNAEIDARMSLAAGWTGLWRRKTVLTIGMPLIAAFNAKQLVCVLAHELGHARSSYALFTYVLSNRVMAWLDKCIYQHDAWDEYLAKGLRNAHNFLVRACLRIIAAGILLVRLWLRALFWMVSLSNRLTLRQMELAADRMAIHMVGSATFEEVAFELRKLLHAHAAVEMINQAAWKERRLLDDIPQAVVDQYQELTSDQVLQIREAKLRYTPWLAHPAHHHRLQQARKLNSPGIFVADYPVRNLLPGFDNLCRDVTLRGYVAQNLDDIARCVKPYRDLLAHYDTRRRAESALKTYFGSLFTSMRFMRLSEPGLASHMHLSAQVDEIRRRQPEFRNALTHFEQQLQRLGKMHTGLLLVERDVDIDLEAYGFQGSAIPIMKRAIEVTEHQVLRSEVLSAMDLLFTRRIHFAIARMDQAEAKSARWLLKVLNSMATERERLIELQTISSILALSQDLLQVERNRIGRSLQTLTRQLCAEVDTVLTQASHIMLGQYNLEYPTLERFLRARMGDITLDARKLSVAQAVVMADSLLHGMRFFYLKLLGDLSMLCERVEQSAGIPALMSTTAPAKNQLAT
ncbi:MAG: M48 family metalloprotease [Gammaproteobacteria bacterium]|nr:M48 family metalloprotease [Gammaproteobacteria bacterium]